MSARLILTSIPTGCCKNEVSWIFRKAVVKI